jgi:DNA polymerase III sliding clamp (beta) subunit (PCNA family)
MIRFDVKELKRFISKASKFVLKGMHPVILNYIYTSLIDSNRAKLTVTDARTFYSETIPVNGKTDMPFLLNLKQLRSIVTNMKSGYVEVDGNTIKIGGVNIQAQNRGVNVKDYPAIPEIKNIDKVSINEFKKLKTIMFKQDYDGKAPFSSLIYINVKDKEAVRTDRHKLSACKINCEGKKDIKIPDFIVSLIDSSKVEIQCDSENNLRVVGGNAEIITKMDDVRYPDSYKNVFPQEYQAEILLPGSIIEKLKLLQNKHIKFQVKNNKIDMFYWNEGICENFINDIGKVERGEVEVSFNKEYLLWLLSPAIANLDLKRRVVIKACLNSEPSPSLFCLVGNDDWKALLMPVRF